MREARHKQVESMLKTKIDLIIRSELNDPRLDLMSITHVIVAKDLGVATVYVSHMGDDQLRKTIVEVLIKASGFIEKILARSVRLRKIPKLIFKLDDSLIHAAKIDELLGLIKAEEQEEKREESVDISPMDKSDDC
ncbi:MAG: 30S ribosome-binding factor RbfA [bacterium]